MDPTRFDALTRALTGAAPTRRRLLAGLAGGALGALATALGFTEAGATHYECRHVGKPCTKAGQCCSGLCKRKTCRAHGAGTCKQQGQELVCTAPDVALARCDNEANCGCVRTTAGSNYCADFRCRSGGPGGPFCGGCAACKRDADCVAQGFPEGSACASATTGRCQGACESGTFCAVPCGTVSGTPPPS